MILNQKLGYYTALLDWCDIECSNTNILESPDGSFHCYFKGRRVDFQDDRSKRLCLKCPYGTDWKWKLKAFGGSE